MANSEQSHEAIDTWIANALIKAGVKVHSFSTEDGHMLLGDVPPECSRAIAVLAAGIHAMANGQKLPCP